MEEKKSADYYRDQRFLFRIGKVSYQKAHRPLSKHTHGDCIELVFMMKGCQTYQVEQETYTIYGGDVFLTFPEEEHSTGRNPEEKAGFFYLIVDLKQFVNGGEICLPMEKNRIFEAYEKGSKRIRRAKTWYGEACLKIWSLCLGDDSFKHTKIRNILSLLLMDIAEQEESTESKKGWEIEKALDYIKKNIKRNFSIEEIAEEVHISVPRFKVLFMNAVGIPPGEYVLREKLECCKQELSESKKSITELAYEYGFSSSQYFSTVFKRYCMVTPSVYRKQLENMAEEV